MIDDHLLLRYHYSEINKLFPYRIAKELEVYPLFIAFSPKNQKSIEYAKILTKGLNKLRGTEDMAIILKKYGLIERDILSPKFVKDN